jgi:beta-lactamase regulating signal transducer with metallopeptidase domain
MIAALAITAVAGFALPHALPLQRVSPVTASVIWVSALSLRALTAVWATGWLVLFFPSTGVFQVLTDWCWPHLFASELNGHDVGHVTTLLPSVLGLLSIVSVSLGTVKLTRALRRLIAESARRGPAGSVIIGGRDIVLAVAGLRKPRVLVSAGALLELGEDELAAALAHERAHIERRHRYVLVYAELCNAVARVVPGTRHALDELAFHLERDADHRALDRRADRGALAAALTKAARVSLEPRSVAMALGGSRVQQRVDEIMSEAETYRSKGSVVEGTVAAVLVSLVVAVGVAVPSVFAAGVNAVRDAPAAIDCSN